MNELIGAIFIGLPYGLALTLGLSIAAFGLLVLAQPRLAVYPILLLILTVSGNNYGMLDAARSFYSRGSGVLFFSFVVWGIVVTYVWGKVASAFSAKRYLACNMRPWLVAWVVLVLGHVVVGLWMGVPLQDSLSPSGLINIVWMALLVFLVLDAFGDAKRIVELGNFLVIVGLSRAMFGLVRWAAFGGDPANAYANRHGLNLKLTFFDINDGLVCLLALVIAAIRLFSQRDQLRAWYWSAIYWVTLAAAPLCIVLSFRRTAWFGFLLATAYAIWFLPKRQRLWSIALAVPVAIVGMGYAAIKRLSQTKGATGLESMFFEFQSRGTGAVSARALELKLAWADFVEYPILGLGTWGHYSGSQLISWQAEAGGSYLHSGVLHVALKAGLVGLVMLFGTYLAFALFCKNARPKINEPSLSVFVAGVAGTLFMMPDLIIGTPIPQLRTMLMYGLCFALPYAAFAASVSSGVQQKLVAKGSAARPVVL